MTDEVVDVLGIYVDTANPDSDTTCSYTSAGFSFDVAPVTADLHLGASDDLATLAGRRIQLYSERGEQEQVDFVPVEGLGDEAVAYDSGDDTNYVIAVRSGDDAFVLSVLDLFGEASAPLPDVARSLAEIALDRI